MTLTNLPPTTLCLFSSGNSEMAFFVLMSTKWLSELATGDKANDRLSDFWRGCMNLHTPGSHQSSLNNISDELTRQGNDRTWVE